MKIKKTKDLNEDLNENKNKENRTNFFKQIYDSINKLEKYPEMASNGFKVALLYLLKLTIFLAIIISLLTIYQFKQSADELSKYLSEKVPDFSYSNNMMKLENNENAFIDENSKFGEVIIDTNTEDKNLIQDYENKIIDNGSGIIILKNKMIIKEEGIKTLINVDHKDFFEQVKITEFVKQDIIDFINSNAIYGLMFLMFFVLFVYSLIGTFINTLVNVIAISLFGYLASMIMKMKLKYVGIFNMAVYSVTLSVLLEIFYMIINTFTKFSIQYFDVMYILVAAIYMFAAIFILKSDTIKKNQEVQKVVDVENEVKKEEENKKQEEKDKKEKDELKKKDENEQNRDNENKDKKDDTNVNGKLGEEGN